MAQYEPTCWKCRQSFVTRRLLESHVCPGFDMSTPVGRAAYREQTESFHMKTRGEGTRGNVEVILDFLKAMSVPEREMLIYDLGFMSERGLRHIARQIDWMGGYVRDGGIYWGKPPNWKTEENEIAKLLVDMLVAERVKFLRAKGVDPDKHNVYQAARALRRRGFRAKDGRIKQPMDDYGVGSMFVSAKDCPTGGPTLSITSSTFYSDYVSTTMREFAQEGEDEMAVSLDRFLHDEAEEQELSVARLNELIRITRRPDWKERVLASLLISTDVEEADLFPEDFEEEAE